MRKSYDLGYREARLIIDVVVEEAGRRNLPVVVCVVDSRGDLVALARMDNTPLHSVHSAINKAYTAARFRMDSGELLQWNRKIGKTLATWTDRRYTDAAGGLAVTLTDGTVVGAIGVGGRPYGPEDVELAQKGLEHVRKILPKPKARVWTEMPASNMPTYNRWMGGNKEYGRWKAHYRRMQRS